MKNMFCAAWVATDMHALFGQTAGQMMPVGQSPAITNLRGGKLPELPRTRAQDVSQTCLFLCVFVDWSPQKRGSLTSSQLSLLENKCGSMRNILSLPCCLWQEVEILKHLHAICKWVVPQSLTYPISTSMTILLLSEPTTFVVSDERAVQHLGPTSSIIASSAYQTPPT